MRNSLKVEKGEYTTCVGTTEPCYYAKCVNNESYTWRIAPTYRSFTFKTSTGVTMFIDGEFDGYEEFDIEFEDLTPGKVKEIIRDTFAF